MSGKLSVCVIGAGAAGLCAARHLAEDPGTFNFDVFEQTDDIGGTWVYNKSTGIDESGLPIHSSMYKNLRTNIPQEIMGFPDYPFPEGEETSYPSHEVVLDYLKDYASHFDLFKKIYLRTVVRLVKPCGRGWSVTVYSLETKTEDTLLYDAVLVCNGHYSNPHIPDIRDIELFQGTVMHSHDYREPEVFKGQTVALLGAASSGRDIAIEIATKAKSVYLCHNKPPMDTELPENMMQLPGIAAATEAGFVLRDGAGLFEADALVICTGYDYSFPFLSRECGVRVRGRRVQPLFKHLINARRPTMALVGLVFLVVPFPLFHYQVAYFLKTLLDPAVLPTAEEMLQDEENEFRLRLEKGFPPRYAHRMEELQWAYNDALADAAGLPRLHPAYPRLYAHSSRRMRADLMRYRQRCYRGVFGAPGGLPPPPDEEERPESFAPS